MEGPALAGEDVLAGLAGEVVHFLERCVEAAAVGDPLLVARGVLGRQDPGYGRAGVFAGQLPVGAVALLGMGQRQLGLLQVV